MRRIAILLLGLLAGSAHASILFDANDEDATVAAAVCSGHPCAVGGWFKRAVLSPGAQVFNIDDGTTNDRFAGFFDASDQFVCRTTDNGSNADAVETEAVDDTTTWHAFICIFEASDDRSAEVDNGGAHLNAVNRTPTGFTTTRIGNMANDNSDADARIAHVWFISAVPTAQQQDDFFGGDCPSDVFATDREAYYPFTDSGGLGNDAWGANDLTVDGATHDADDPSVSCVTGSPLRRRRSN